MNVIIFLSGTKTLQCLGTAQWNGTPPACYPLQKPSAALTEEFDKSKAEANELAKELGLEVAKERGKCTIYFFFIRCVIYTSVVIIVVVILYQVDFFFECDFSINHRMFKIKHPKQCVLTFSIFFLYIYI